MHKIHRAKPAMNNVSEVAVRALCRAQELTGNIEMKQVRLTHLRVAAEAAKFNLDRNLNVTVAKEILHLVRAAAKA